ncbi:hypothetical protein F0919_01045 [Taibaiella lutea]|uniref:Uncharacterized protein n=1 Tax=Taibaiella lutea TaxID=2608001 RepID=A0A5M6CMC3_9BACT|nr:hypothetical protein [Taibaiella lutea]KAA5536284.1 hypothetical protein F0919_01045 [Taibaiella lutea]
MVVALLIFFALVVCISNLSYFKILGSNARRRKDIKKRDISQSKNKDNTKALGELIEELNFPLVTFDCDKTIETIRSRFIECKHELELFCVIIDISNCFHNQFAIVGNFVGTEIIPSKHENHSISKLYSANILFRKNDDALTLLSTFPEDKDHDFFIKDFTTRIKEILK